MIKAANKKAVELSMTLRKYNYKYFVTLTYDNEHVPFIYEDMDGFIFRGQGENVEQIDSFDELVDWSINYKKLTNHCFDKAIGVLYFYDVQCFFKRFRKYIKKHYGKREFKYFLVGEYGTYYARPHYHIVIMSDELLYDECQSACVECWKMHDWSRFWKADEEGNFVNEGCKQCTEGCAAYISSYVNSNSNNVPISLYKTFRQKTVRSKNIAFGLDASILEGYKQDVVRIASNVGESENRRVLYYWKSDDQTHGVSLELLPARYIYTFFHKFKGWSEISDELKLSRAFRIVGDCQKQRKIYSRSLVELDLKSDDLSFYRSYERFVNWFGDMCIADYLVLMIKVINVYKSNLLREQMKQYEVIGKQQYYLSLIDTKIENPEKRKFYLRVHGVGKSLLKDEYLNCPPLVRSSLDASVWKYRKRLLPKHLNDMNNILNYF